MASLQCFGTFAKAGDGDVSAGANLGSLRHVDKRCLLVFAHKLLRKSADEQVVICATAALASASGAM